METSGPSLDCALFVEYAVSTPPRAVLFFQAFLRFFCLMWAILMSILSFLQYRFCFMLWFSDPEIREIFAPQPGIEGPPYIGR